MMRTLLISGALAAFSAAGSQFFTATRATEPTEPEWVVLEVVGEASVAHVPYGIPVVEIRKPPSFATQTLAPIPGAAANPQTASTPIPSKSSGCPVELRAIVAGGAPDGFAMIGVAGESKLVRRGERIATASGTASVSRIATNHIILTGTFGTRRCVLDSER
ncbi:MAG: hypothetical protein AAF658_04900 [Myxococcota bacterium]